MRWENWDYGKNGALVCRVTHVTAISRSYILWYYTFEMWCHKWSCVFHCIYRSEEDHQKSWSAHFGYPQHESEMQIWWLDHWQIFRPQRFLFEQNWKNDVVIDPMPILPICKLHNSCDFWLIIYTRVVLDNQLGGRHDGGYPSTSERLASYQM